MTLDGTINKTITLLGLVSIAAMLSYSIVSQTPGLGFMITIGGAIGGTILALAFYSFVQIIHKFDEYVRSAGRIVHWWILYMIENYYLGGTEGLSCKHWLEL